jgi:hypothetical protein
MRTLGEGRILGCGHGRIAGIVEGGEFVDGAWGDERNQRALIFKNLPQEVKFQAMSILSKDAIDLYIIQQWVSFQIQS